MKKTLLIAISLIVAINALAQLDVNKPTVKTATSGLDPSIVGRSIMDILTPRLKLNDDQNSNVTILVGQFLTHKSNFMELKKSKPADYKTKLASEQRVLFDGLKGALNPEQFIQLMDLKPSQAGTENAMGHLFY